MQQATLSKSGSEAASQLQGRIARAFSSNSLVSTMDVTAAIQYILTAEQSLDSQVCYKKSRMTILGLAGTHTLLTAHSATIQKQTRTPQSQARTGMSHTHF